MSEQLRRQIEAEKPTPVRHIMLAVLHEGRRYPEPIQIPVGSSWHDVIQPWNTVAETHGHPDHALFTTNADSYDFRDDASKERSNSGRRSTKTTYTMNDEFSRNLR
jgi:hypothetical protein